MPNTDAANKIMDRYGAAVVKSDAAAGIKGDTYVIGYPLQLVSSSKVSEKTVYTLVKAWWDNLPELQTIHPLFKRWTKETAGADKFYRALSSRSDPILQGSRRLDGQARSADERDLQIAILAEACRVDNL